MVKVQKYFSIFSLSFKHALKNYKALIGLSLFLMTCLVIFAHLWKIAAAKTGAVIFNPAQLLWYIAFNEWVLVSIPDTQDEMEQDLRSGRLAYLLPRPISYLGGTFAEAFGTLTVNLLVLGGVTFLFTLWQAGGLPFPPMGLLLSFIFGFMAGIVAILFQMLIGLSAFWLQEVSPFFWIWEKLLFMLGGLMLPLTVYPLWMQRLAHLTPFPAILGDRSALALDFNWHYVLTLACILIGWGLLALIALHLLYRKGLSILNVEGG
ncbi:MAG: hypothetical protein H0V82_13275 [Candidatus Protochlamydia sp.]|nr:hypothetical protein [Candidatus Protochlamydia sp.]